MKDLRDQNEVAKAHAAHADFGSLLHDLEAALRGAIRAFAEYHAADGKITREQYQAWNADVPPEGDYFDGFNAGVESVLGAVDTFLEEFTLR
jgi:hypothetical protein